jgi:hypothetical protein
MKFDIQFFIRVWELVSGDQLLISTTGSIDTFPKLDTKSRSCFVHGYFKDLSSVIHSFIIYNQAENGKKIKSIHQRRLHHSYAMHFLQ